MWTSDNFVAACSDADLPLAAAISEAVPIDKEDAGFALRCACDTGAYAAVEWLCRGGDGGRPLFGIDSAEVRYGDLCALRWACRGGHLSIARLLCRDFGIGPRDVDPHRAAFIAVREAAALRGHLDVVGWMGSALIP